MRLSRRLSTCVCVTLGYVLVALALSWPLPLHLNTHLTGGPGGDTGVYVWNTWVFKRELLSGKLPYFTNSIFWSGREANLSLHNYTPVADLMALVLQPAFGVIASFNLVYLLNAVLTGLGMYALARRYTSDRAVAWMAGAVFMMSPFLVTRGTGHFSLAAAAPLPLFVLYALRVCDQPSWRRAAPVGLLAAWAGLSDPYYLVYCLMLGVGIAVARTWNVTVSRRADAMPINSTDGAVLIAAAAVALLAWSRVQRIEIGPVVVTMGTLYNPVLLVTLLATARVTSRFRWSITLNAVPGRELWHASLAAASTALLLLSPWLVALVQRVREGTMVSAPVPWRSSTPGVDVLGLLVPNPNHPLMPEFVRQAISAGPGGYIEQVAALPLMAVVLIAVAWRRGHRLSPGWVVLTVGALLLSLGPFIHVAGINTYIPTPWVLLRYVPIIGDARAPSRFAVIAAMGCAVLLARALSHWRWRAPNRRHAVLAAAAALLAFELVPAPRPLYSASVPSIYDIVAADTRPVAVLELPFGLRDGLSSLGDFTAKTQFFQTYHGKPVFGGYLSRISDARKARYRARAVLGPIMTLSEGGTLTQQARLRAEAEAPIFLSTSSLGYVVIDRTRASAELRSFAIELFGLQKVAEGGGRELFVPADPAAVHAAR